MPSSHTGCPRKSWSKGSYDLTKETKINRILSNIQPFLKSLSHHWFQHIVVINIWNGAISAGIAVNK